MHPDAKKNFIEKSFEILKKIVEYKPPEIRNIKTDHYIDTVITENDFIDEIKNFELTNANGVTVGLVILNNNTQYFIDENDYQSLEQLSRNISKQKCYESTVSYTFINNKLKEWLTLTFRDEINIDFIEYLTNELKDEIVEYEIWIPVPFTSIETEFTLGKTTFKTITENIIDKWLSSNNPVANSETTLKIKQSLQKEYQGCAAGVITFICELNMLKNYAFEEIKKSLSVLRLFSPTNFNSALISGAYEFGWNMYESEKAIYFCNSKSSLQIQSKLLDNGLRWHIDETIINILASDKYENFHKILTIDKPSELQKTIIDSLIIYSKNTLRRETFDKILYILVSLETMLLKNNTEPIQQNLADRIAFALANSTEGRKEIVDLIKKIYSLRSGFVHHGKIDMESNDAVVEFMNVSFQMITSVINNHDNFKDKYELINAIENIKYS